MMKVNVEVYRSIDSYEQGDDALYVYSMDHDDQAQRRVLGQQCRNAFEAGQVIVTYADKKSR